MCINYLFFLFYFYQLTKQANICVQPVISKCDYPISFNNSVYNHEFRSQTVLNNLLGKYADCSTIAIYL